MKYDYDLKRDMEERWKVAQPLQTQFWQQAERDTRMYVGLQNNSYFSPYNRNEGLIFNKVLRIVNMIQGYQIKNRMVNTIIPVDNSDNKTADQLTKVLYWVSQRARIYDLISEAFGDALVTGFSMISMWIDHRNDPISGDINARVVPFANLLVDPWFKKQDMSDAEWIWNRSYRSKEAVLALFPKLEKDGVLNIRSDSSTMGGKFPYIAENYGGQRSKLFSYDEYWTRDVRKEERLVDLDSGEVMIRPKNMSDDMLQAFMRYNPNIRVTNVKVPTVKYHVLVNDQLVYEEKTPYGLDQFPYVPFLCYFNPEVADYGWRYFGVVRNIRDAQYELNKRRNKMLDIMDSVVNSGIIVKEGALVNPEDAFLNGQGRVYYLRDEAQISDIQQVPAPNIPPSMFEFQKILDDEIMNISGASEELFGTSDDPTISGFLTQLRMGAGLISLGNIFDKVNYSQKMVGNLLMRMIQENFSVGKVRRIINEQPTEEFKTSSFAKYDCVVEEGTLTSTQKQLQFVQLLQLRNMGIPIPTKNLIDASTLQNKNELLEAIMQTEMQQQQVQQAQAQAEILKSQMVAQTLNSEAENNLAMAQERKARTISNLGLAVERQAQATHDRTKSALDLTKMAKELEGLDEDRLMKIANFLLELNERQRQEEAKDVAQKTQEVVGVGVVENAGENEQIGSEVAVSEED